MLASFWELLKRQGSGKEGALLVNGHGTNSPYIRDANDIHGPSRRSGSSVSAVGAWKPFRFQTGSGVGYRPPCNFSLIFNTLKIKIQNLLNHYRFVGIGTEGSFYSLVCGEGLEPPTLSTSMRYSTS